MKSAREGSNDATKDHTVRKTDRLEAFSDAVLAIAITLPVVTLQSASRQDNDVAGEYLRAWPEYAAYGVAFFVVGLYWVHSHFSGKIIVETDHGYNLLTLLFVGVVSIVPVPARAFAHHVFDADNQQTAAAVLAVSLLAPSLVWLVRWSYAVRRGLPDPRLEPAYVKRVTRQHVLATAAYAGGAILCVVGVWRIGLVVSGCTLLGYLRPPLQPRYLPGREPPNELQEADEVPQQRDP